MDVHPLKFEPIFKPRIWGGRRLESRLNKKLPSGAIGESWELVDLESDQSVVAAGPMKGRTLSQLVQLWGRDLLGNAQLANGRFPLLLKFLDSNQALSIQVHPSPEVAVAQPGDRLKNEAWYVIDATSDAWMLRGLKSHVSFDALRSGLTSGTIESLLNRVALRNGHAFYIPSGTVHALGPGALIAEIQTPSDTTYRLHDWNRVDPRTGRPRELHFEQGLASVSLSPVPPESEKPEHVVSVWTAISRLIRCDSFVVERVRMVDGVEQAIPYDEMVVWMVLSGAGAIACDGLAEPFRFATGDTVLLPAALRNGRVSISEVTTWLEITVPIRSDLADLTRIERRSMRSDPRQTYVPLNIRSELEGK